MLDTILLGLILIFLIILLIILALRKPTIQLKVPTLVLADEDLHTQLNTVIGELKVIIDGAEITAKEIRRIYEKMETGEEFLLRELHAINVLLSANLKALNGQKFEKDKKRRRGR